MSNDSGFRPAGEGLGDDRRFEDLVGGDQGVGDETTPRREPPTLSRIAYHETGHAVMAWILGQFVRKVTIIPDPTTGFLGLMKSYRLKLPRGNFYPVDPRWESWIGRPLPTKD